MRVAGAHVLLTGATGDIGARLATHLTAAGADVTCVARGLAGDVVVTPMELADGRILLVERGFEPLGQGLATTAPARGQPAAVSRRPRPPTGADRA